MHIRISTVTRGAKTYRYAQLVETFRRPKDGMPAHRVIATLGDPDSLDVQNLRAALVAARDGKQVAVVRHTRPADSASLKPTASLRYLDLAVLLAFWREVGLDELLTELLPQGDGHVAPASIVAALVLQRCVEPGSKLYAARWMPRTALPELLGIAPEQFNNTRLHRVLDDLDDSTSSLMARLPHRYVETDGEFVSLFLDVSDTWFVGDGPALAARGKTKEGRIEKKIGIVLLCNQDGLPLRWEVISGSQADPTAMTRMLGSVRGVSWADQVPIVCDRSMGTTAMVRGMLETGLRFVTALTRNEFDAYAPSLPHAAFAPLAPHDEDSFDADLASAIERASTSGLVRHSDDLFVLDLGIIERPDVAQPSHTDFVAGSNAAVMRMTREIDESVEHGRFSSYAAAGRSLGLGKAVVSKYRALLGLSEQQQRHVLEGHFDSCSLAALLDVAAITDPEARAAAFEASRRHAAASKPKPPGRRKRPTPPPSSPTPVRVRAVAYFNPRRFVEQRLAANNKIEAIKKFVTELRARITAAPGRYSEQQVYGLVDRELRSRSLLDVFKVTLPAPAGLEVTLDQAAWALRRRYDGFTVLVAHPELRIGAAELCRLYRAKDAVEKDFQIIKSVVQLRPVWHHTDAKVRAHVTICMLALLLERLLRRRLEQHELSERAALQLLEDCRLARYGGHHGRGVYAVTELDAEQRSVLKALRLLHLADDDHMASTIHPR